MSPASRFSDRVKNTMAAPFVRTVARVLLLIAAMAPAGAVHAAERPLDAPRAQGLIGERYDGLAVVHDPKAPPAVQKLAEDINAQRRQVYAAKAAAQGVPVLEVGKVYATEIMNKAPAGTWFQGADGTWKQK